MNTTLPLNQRADRAEEIFEEQIKARVAEENPDDFLTIDIVSGDYEIGTEDLPTENRLHNRRPEAIIFMRRVGDEAAYYVGGGFAN